MVRPKQCGPRPWEPSEHDEQVALFKMIRLYSIKVPTA
jgi:hypothetical protein